MITKQYFFIEQQAVIEMERKTSVVEDNHDAESSENSTDLSPDQSDEKGPTSVFSSGSWQVFARTKFSVKASHSYCCAALPQPLLQKRDKADHLVRKCIYLFIYL